MSGRNFRNGGGQHCKNHIKPLSEVFAVAGGWPFENLGTPLSCGVAQGGSSLRMPRHRAGHGGAVPWWQHQSLNGDCDA